MTLEPVPIPDRYLEPPEPEPAACDVCDRDSDACECGNCDACGSLGPTQETTSGDEELWLCETCRAEEQQPTRLTITIDLTGDAFAEHPAEEVYRILSDVAGLIGFTEDIQERILLDINGNTVGHLTLAQGDDS